MALLEALVGLQESEIPAEAMRIRAAALAGEYGEQVAAWGAHLDAMAQQHGYAFGSGSGDRPRSTARPAVGWPGPQDRLGRPMPIA